MSTMEMTKVEAREAQIETTGGLKLFVRSWRPEGAARGVVVMVPGFNSHGGYYLATGEALAGMGLAAYAIDLRGRGKSDGDRFYVQNYSDYVDDIGAAVKKARAENPGLPVFLLGHSAGGVASCLYVLEHQKELAGFICESFAYQVPAPDFALAVFKGLAHLAPHAHVLHLKNEFFSRDAKVVKAMNEDPLIAHETQPTQTLAELVRADEKLKKGFATITLPLLILHGTADKATKSAGSQEFHDMAGSTDKTLKLYKGAFHDLLNDLGKEAVMSDIETWLNAHLK